MKNYAAVLLTIIITGLTFSNSYAQEEFADYAGFRNIGITSPTAAGLGEYGSIPVNYATGVPNISIPLASISAGKISVPVSLSYHAAGIKVSEQSGPVGMGWSLNAGGVITRVVKGFPDEVSKDEFGLTYSGFFEQLENLDDFTNGFTQEEREEYLLDIAKNKIDAESDVYFYNFSGKSGFFTINGEGNFSSFPDANLKIEYTISFNKLTSFTITTEDGTVYNFGGGTGESVEKTETLPNDSQDPSGGFVGKQLPYTGVHATAWYLRSIEHPTQSQEIIFTYYKDQSYDYNAQETLSASSVTYKWGAPGSQSVCPAEGASISAGSYSKQRTVAPVRVTSIQVTGSHTDKKINFSYTGDSNNDPLFYRLSKIEVSRSLLLEKRINFNYGTFNSFGSLLKLESIQEEYFDQEVKPPYEFTYYDGYLKQRQTMDRDYLGYQRGNRGNNLIGLYQGSTITFGTSRAPNISHTKRGVLKKIKYPTGGYSLFDYELNRAQISEESKAIGGLRIKKISAKPDSLASETLIKEYEYGPGSVSSYLYQIVSKGYYRTQLQDYTKQTEECTMEMGISEASTPLFGHYVTYDKVTEIIDGGEGGRVTHSYTYYGGGGYDSKYSKAFPYTKQVQKDAEGPILSETINEYEEGPLDTTMTQQIPSIKWLRPDIKLVPHTISGPNGTTTVHDTLYHFKSGLYQTKWIQLVKKSVNRYRSEFRVDSTITNDEEECVPPGQPAEEPFVYCQYDIDEYYVPVDTVGSITEHAYRDSTHKQPTEITRINSDGDRSTTSYRYAHEFYPGMESLFMLRQPYSITVQDSSGTVINKQWLKWADFTGSGQWLPTGEWVWDSN